MALKLSMWTLANALAPLEPEVHIGPDSPMVLRSGRLACATNCVHVRQEGTDCLCVWENDTIRIFDMDAREGVELVQSVFDAMNDWYAGLKAAAAAQDYQRLVDMCHVVLRSPVLLGDENGCVLGISTHYGADEVDEEWRYLKTYGYASLQAIENIGTSLGAVAVSNEVVRLPLRHPGRYSGGLTTRVFRRGRPLGRLTVLERERPLNRGDVQIVQQIAALLADSLQPGHTGGSGGSYLSRLLEGEPLGETAWEHLSRTRGWQLDHTCRLYGFFGDIREPALLQETVGRTVAHCLCTVVHGRLWVLVNETLGSGETIGHQLCALAGDNGFHLAGSLPGIGVETTVCWAEQVRYAAERGAETAPRETFWDFARWAVDYLLWGTREERSLVAACHPDVRQLWRERQTGDGMLYDTLRTYLERERSAVHTAQVLFIHKNTLFYRLHKLETLLTADLDDPRVRLHLQLSFRILEQQKNDRP